MVRQPRNLAIRGDDSERMRVLRDAGWTRSRPASGGTVPPRRRRRDGRGEWRRGDREDEGFRRRTRRRMRSPPRVVKGGGSFVRSRVGSVVRGQRGQLRLQDVAHRDVLRDVCGRRGKGARARSSASRWLSERKRRRDGVDASRVGEFRVGIARGVRTVRKAVDAEGGGESHELVQLVRLERALRVSNGLGTVSARSVGSREARGDHDRSKIVAFSTVEVRCRSGGKDRDARARVFDAPRAATCRGRRPTAGISPRGCSPGRPSWPPSRRERGGSLANALGLERFRAVWRWRELVGAAARSAAG